MTSVRQRRIDLFVPARPRTDAGVQLVVAGSSVQPAGVRSDAPAALALRQRVGSPFYDQFVSLVLAYAAGAIRS